MSVEDIVPALATWKKRTPVYDLFRRYYVGEHPMRFATQSFRRHYEWILRDAKENLCEALVSSFTGPVTITGWEGASAKPAAELARILDIPRLANMVHDEAHTCGDAYVLVWEDYTGMQRPFFHRADQMVCVTYDGTNVMRYAAKFWVSDKKPRVNLYYEDRVERYIAAGISLEDGGTADFPDKAESYSPFTSDGFAEVIPHQHGEVPVAWMARDQKQFGKMGTSILRNAIPLQDGLNHSLASLIVGNEAYSQPLRLLLGIEPEGDSVVQVIDGKVVRKPKSSLNIDPTKQNIVGVPGEHVSAHQFDPPDPSKLILVQDAFANKMARVVGLPAYYLTQSLGDVPSGISLRTLRERMTNAILDFTTDQTGEWTKVQRLLGMDASPVWAEPAPLDPLEKIQVATAKNAIGYPFEEILRDLGEDEDDIVRIMQLKQGADQQAAEREAIAATAALRQFQGAEEE